MNVSNINEGNHLHCLHILVSRLFNSKFDANIKVIVFRAVHKWIEHCHTLLENFL